MIDFGLKFKELHKEQAKTHAGIFTQANLLPTSVPEGGNIVQWGIQASWQEFFSNYSKDT